MKKNTYYITTTLPYVNADPHIGFALEIVQADTLARYKKLNGFNVFFNFGTDEHGKKIYDKALDSNQDPKVYCDEYASKFESLKKALNLSYNNFIRTTDPYHIEACREFWRRCSQNGDIYKKKYKTKYCVGCELEKTDSELENGHCTLHPNLILEIIEEENYFFRFSRYQKQLLQLYSDFPNFVVPSYRLKEINKFVKQGLTDFSISRLKSKMPWGIDVPDDPDHVMYVWFDALINYVSAIGWPNDQKKFESWWPVTQLAGKDNLRQQSAIWQAMLMSAGIPNSKQIFIHGFITVDGQKISKSLGNIVDPHKIVSKYGTDALRYYLLREIPAYNDGDFSEARFRELYNADLANGLGNLVARTLGMIIKYCDAKIPVIDKDPDCHPLRIDKNIDNWKKSWTAIDKFLPEFQYHEALTAIWKFIKTADKYIDDNKPWELAKNNQKQLHWVLYGLADSIHQIAWQIYPFLPETAIKIAKLTNISALQKSHPLNKDSWKNIEQGTKIGSNVSLFPRLA